MIWGRPTNLWLGVVTAFGGFVGTVLIIAGVDPTTVAQLVSTGGILLGSVIALVAGQPPTIHAGERVNVHTNGSDAPNVTAKVDVTPQGQAQVTEQSEAKYQ